MGRNDETSTIAALWPGAAAAVGALLIGAGLLMPALSDPARAVTQQQADDYYAAAAAVEQAAANKSKRRRTGEIPDSAEQARELQAARNRFQDAQQQIDEAKNDRQRVASWLKIGGFTCVVLGAGGLLVRCSGD